MEFKPDNETAVVIRRDWAGTGSAPSATAAAGIIVGTAQAKLSKDATEATDGYLVRREDGAKGGGPGGEWWCPAWALEPVQLPLGAEVRSLPEGMFTGAVTAIRTTMDGDQYYIGDCKGPFGRLELELVRPEKPAAALPPEPEATPAPSSCEPCKAALAGSWPLNDGARYPSPLPNDSAERKELPLFKVLFETYPAAMVALTRAAVAGNNKHNPGQELHHSRNKSNDHEDCIARHLMEGDYEAILVRSAMLVQVAWEREGKAPVAKRARFD